MPGTAKIVFSVLIMVLIIMATLINPGFGIVGAALTNREAAQQPCEEAGNCLVQTTMPLPHAPAAVYIPPLAPQESSFVPASLPAESEAPVDGIKENFREEKKREPAVIYKLPTELEPIDLVAVWFERIYDSLNTSKTTLPELQELLKAVENNDDNKTAKQLARWQTLHEEAKMLQRGKARSFGREHTQRIVQEIKKDMKITLRTKQFFWNGASNFHGDCNGQNVSVLEVSGGEMQIFFHNLVASNAEGPSSSSECNFTVGIRGANYNDGAWLDYAIDGTATKQFNSTAAFVLSVNGNSDPNAGQAVNGNAVYSGRDHFLIPDDYNADIKAIVSVKSGLSGEHLVDAKMNSVKLRISNDGLLVDSSVAIVIFTSTVVIGLLFGF